MIIRTTSTQTCPGKEQWGVPRSPLHPRRFPWKSVHSPILLPGLPEEILEGSYNAALPVPEGSPSTEKALQADSTSQPRGDTDPPPVPHCPALPEPASPRAAGQQHHFVLKTQNYIMSSGLIAQDPTGGRDMGTVAAVWERCCHGGCASAHSGPPLLPVSPPGDIPPAQQTSH